MAASEAEKRRDVRIRAALPLRADGAAGITRDVSESGIFFETDACHSPGSRISLFIDVSTPGGRITLECSGEIVRVERRAGRVGVAVRITESTIVPGAAEGRPAPA
jgi:hypothetical protein